MNNPTPAPQTREALSPSDVTDSATAKLCKANAILELINECTTDADSNAINGGAWAVREFVAEAETDLLNLIEVLTARLDACEKATSQRGDT